MITHHIMLVPQQVYVAPGTEGYTSKYVEQFDCNFIVKATEAINYMVRDDQEPNLMVSEKHQFTNYVFYVAGVRNDIKEAINTVNNYFKTTRERRSDDFEKAHGLKEITNYLEKDSYDSPLDKFTKYGWEINHIERNN